MKLARAHVSEAFQSVFSVCFMGHTQTIVMNPESQFQDLQHSRKFSRDHLWLF
jgi:hypothetical protein